jgi:hypothetical protein
MKSMMSAGFVPRIVSFVVSDALLEQLVKNQFLLECLM